MIIFDSLLTTFEASSIFKAAVEVGKNILFQITNHQNQNTLVRIPDRYSRGSMHFHPVSKLFFF